MLAIYHPKSYSFTLVVEFKKVSKNWIYLLTILLFSIAGMKSLLQPGLFTAHDIWHQVVRFYYYSQAINDGQFPPFWISTLANGYGYPLFGFSYHLPWLVGVLLLKIGFEFSNSLKILFFSSYFFSGITMYFFAIRLLKDKVAALASSILYLWLPYHFLIIFVGASIGIAFVFTFLPLIFLGIVLLKDRSSFGIPLAAIGLSGVILSHIMHIVYLLPSLLFFIAWALVSVKAKFQFIRNLFLGILLAILICSFYLIPAAYYSKYSRVNQEEGITKLYERNFITLKQLAYSKWGYSPIINNAKNGEISFQLGIAQWFALIILVILICSRKISPNNKTLSIYLFLAFTLNIFLMLDISAPIWKFLIKFVTLDFPFRLILPATFISSLAGGIILIHLSKITKVVVFVSLIIVAIYTNRNHININQSTNLPISSYLDLETEITTNTFHEYLPSKASPRLLNKPWNEAAGEKITFFGTKQTTNSLFFTINASDSTKVSAGQFYFPGQTLYIDEKINKFEVDKEGRISFISPPGIHNIKIEYQQTPLIKLSKLFTAIGILIVVASFFVKKLPKKFTFK